MEHTHGVTAGRDRYKIPSLEMARAMKFAAMISLFRGDVEKMQDATDFLVVVPANAKVDLD